MSKIELNDLQENKKIFFASDFHLGVPNRESSFEREKKIIKWLDHILPEAHSIFILGDVFDFWYEYKHAIPKGFIRFQGKLAEITDAGIPVYFFTGNHDMWMFDYFHKEMNIQVFRKPLSFTLNGKQFHIGHGDALGPGDKLYKIQKRIFENKLCQWAFKWIHPDVGIGLANFMSNQSKLAAEKRDESFIGDNEWIYNYCKDVEKKQHHDYYIFGHRHLPLDMKVNDTSRYINLGEWLNFCTYAEYDGKICKLISFENSSDLSNINC
jgi:UDP-2,3-diacylglucosamine hydrolase